MATTRGKLDELAIIIGDLRMAVDIKGQMDAGEERGLIDFADGERIGLTIPEDVKDRLNSKINELSVLLKTKAQELDIKLAPPE